MATTMRSNIINVTLFNQDLDTYEASSVVANASTQAYTAAAVALKSALARMILATTTADVYSMLRILAVRMADKATGCYSESVITRMAGAIYDEQASQMVMAIVYKTMCVVRGEAVTFSQGDISAVRGNTAIRTFLMNYPNGDASLPLAGQTVLAPDPTAPWDVIHATDALHVQLIGVGRYAISLEGANVSTLRLDIDADHPPAEGTSWISEVWLQPMSPALVLWRSIGFTENALVQAESLGILPKGYQPGVDADVTMNMYDTLKMTLVFSSDVQSWWVADLSVLSPSTVFPK